MTVALLSLLRQRETSFVSHSDFRVNGRLDWGDGGLDSLLLFPSRLRKFFTSSIEIAKFSVRGFEDDRNLRKAPHDVQVCEHVAKRINH